MNEAIWEAIERRAKADTEWQRVCRIMYRGWQPPEKRESTPYASWFDGIGGENIDTFDETRDRMLGQMTMVSGANTDTLIGKMVRETRRLFNRAQLTGALIADARMLRTGPERVYTDDSGLWEAQLDYQVYIQRVNQQPAFA